MTNLKNMPLEETLVDERNAREWMGRNYEGSKVESDILARRARKNVVRPVFGRKVS